MLKKWPAWLILLTLFGVLAVAFTSGSRAQAAKTPGVTVLNPIISVGNRISSSLGSVVYTIANVGRLEKENHQLQEQVAQLERELLRLREAGEENSALRALLGYQRDNPGKQYLAASVVARDPSGIVEAVLMNLGTEQGVQNGMIVVGEGGMVGQVLEAYPNLSKVLLSTDPSLTVNSIVQRSRVQGVVSGTTDGGLTMRYVPKDADVREGDLVVTSGLGGGFPRGLLVGLVVRVNNREQELFQEVTLEPATRVSTLERVLVILDFLPLRLP